MAISFRATPMAVVKLTRLQPDIAQAGSLARAI
jgi:hypothetical protein